MQVINRTPPGILIEKSVNVKPIGDISFTSKYSTTPLQPLAEAILFNNEKIEICAVLFLDAAIGTPQISIYQNYAIGGDGNPLFQFFITYDAQETTAKDFNAYQVNFSFDADGLPDYLKLSDVSAVEIFLWDVDPRDSRGTITNVQPN